MIEETGVVVKVEGDCAWVETQRQTACGQCSAKKGCGTGILGEYFNRRSPLLEIRNAKDVMVGDRIVLGVSESGLITGSFVVYIVPLLAMFITALIGNHLANLFETGLSEPTSILFGVLGFAAGVWFVRRFDRRVNAEGRFQPVILKKL